MIDLSYPKLLDLFPEHRAPKRSESASFLIWYLENYYRLDPLEATDSVCDQPGDKGVDGIFVNDNDQTITLFQSRILQNLNRTIGDKSLREFAGTLTQFQSAESTQHLLDTTGDNQLRALMKRLDLVNKVATHDLRAEFMSNAEADSNGLDFVRGQSGIAFVGGGRLASTFISDERDVPVHGPVDFDISGFTVSEYIVDANTKALIAPIKARQLVTMSGIADQSIFSYNVRGPLGKTNVNKEIAATIKDPTLHKMFPLFHNGITVIAGEIGYTENSISVTDYFVVNGCQSLTSLYSNQSALTDDLRVLVKFISMDPRSASASLITQFSNNQNGVKARDFKSNNPTQIRLQNEFARHYGGEFYFEIKTGDKPEGGTLISNESAGLYLMAFDLKEPWATHRKYEVFEDKYADLFGRPEVTADRIVLCTIVMGQVAEHSKGIANELFAKYVLTQYFLLYVIREILANDELGRVAITGPEAFVRNRDNRQKFATCIGRIVSDVVSDLNEEVKGFGDDFDYRDKLRDAEWVKTLTGTLKKDYLKLVNRGRVASFKSDWEEHQ